MKIKNSIIEKLKKEKKVEIISFSKESYESLRKASFEARIKTAGKHRYSV